MKRTKLYEEICWNVFVGIPIDIEYAINTFVYKQYLENYKNLQKVITIIFEEKDLFSEIEEFWETVYNN